MASRRALPGIGRRSGQALIEMALILPILILFLCAVMHFGILFYTQIGLETAAREAALYAAYHPLNDTAIRTVAMNSLPSLVHRETVIYKTIFTPTRSKGDPLTIQISYNIQVLNALPFGAILPVPTSVFSEISVPIVAVH